MKKEKFIVKCENLKNPWYLAEWEGDPGRTLLIESAKVFISELEAKKEIKKAVFAFPYRNLKNRLKIIQLG